MARFALIGTNRITEQFIKAGSELENFSLKAVYSRTEERAKEFAAKHSIEQTYTDLNEMVQSKDIDAVYIASPNSFHARQAMLCMNHGKHVLCEKPIASNSKELEEMIRTAKKNRVILMEAMKSTLVPNFKAIRENLPKIGKIRRYFASYCQYSSRYDAYKEGVVLNAFNPIFSNGSLMDIGVYCLYPAVVLFGKPQTIKAAGIMLDSGVDGEGSILLKYEEMDAVMMHSKITDSYLPCEIQGENGNMVIDKMNTPEKVVIHYRDGTTEEITKTQSCPSMYYEIKEFIDLVQLGKLESGTNSLKNSALVMEIMDEARKQVGLVFQADK